MLVDVFNCKVTWLVLMQAVFYFMLDKIAKQRFDKFNIF